MQVQPMLKTVRQFFGLEQELDPLPAKIREASHSLQNEAMKLSATARRLEREDPFEAFLDAMRKGPQRDHH